MLRAFVGVGGDVEAFWKLTPAEARLVVDSRVALMQREKGLMAWQIRWLVSPHVKRVPSHNDLMGIKTFRPLLGESYQQFCDRVDNG